MDSSMQQATQRTGVTRGFRIIEGERFPDRTPTLDVDGGESYFLAPFAPESVTVEAGHVMAYNVHTSDKRRERYAVGTARGGRVAWHVDGDTWESFKGYQVRTEDRGHGIIAVYVKGAAGDIKGIERASRAYARERLTFAPGMSATAVGSGGEFRDAGATYISQDVHTTQPLTPRED